MADDETLGVYAERADEYASLAFGADADAGLGFIKDGLPKGADILDLGCGPGHMAAHLRDKGFNVTASDASAEMAGVAMANYGIDVQVAGFADLTAVDIYDAILASFSLLHAPKADMPGHLAAIKRALRPGGRFVIGLKTGQGEKRDRLGRFYAYYTDAELTGLLEAAGFEVAERRTGEGKGLDGSIAPWIVMRCDG